MKKLIVILVLILMTAGAVFACEREKAAVDDDTLLLESLLIAVTDDLWLEMSVNHAPTYVTDSRPATPESNLAALLDWLLDAFFPDTSVFSESGKL